MNDPGVIESIERAVNETLSSHHRRMLIIAGRKSDELVQEAFKIYTRKKRGKISLLIIKDDFEEKYIPLRWMAEKLGCEIRTVKREETSEILGSTWDLMVAYSAHFLTPNSLGRVIETVKGGGLIILEGPELKEWYTVISPFHKRLVSPPSDIHQIKRRFEKRLVEKLYQHGGIWIIENGVVRYESPYPPLKKRRKRTHIPENTKIPSIIYSRAVTQDQIILMRSVEQLMESGRKAVLLSKADRGRGKSSALGMAVAGLILGGYNIKKIFVTAPSSANALTLFEFLIRTLKDGGLKVRKLKEGGESLSIRVDKVRINYLEPEKMERVTGALAVIDEAAGIPLPLLISYLNNFRKVIYASTVHGYEGAGRGFELRFKKRLEQMKGLEIIEVDLEEPVRHSPGDPIERWLYDVLLLDARPADLSESEIMNLTPDKTDYIKVDRDDLFYDDEKRLVQFVGTYVSAHYRNRPDDLLLLGDAPLHFARTLEHNGKVITALHLTMEGGLSRRHVTSIAEGKIPHGQLIPSTVLKYFPTHDFLARERGVRVVRIAVHPELTQRGFGTHALKKLEDELSEEYAWIGAGFGVNRDLLNFWLKNGYVPVHISPVRNATSGEYSVIVVKPLKREIQEKLFRLNLEFKNRLFESLYDTYYSLHPSIAVGLFSGNFDFRYTPELNDDQIGRARAYTRGILSYEGSCDVVRTLLKAHFMSGIKERPELSERLERALIARVLQGKSWDVSARIFHRTEYETIYEFREAVKKLLEYYVEEKA